MANGDPLPQGDTVLRGCSSGFDQGEVTASAFALRPREEQLGRTSVMWVECAHVPETERNVASASERLRSGKVRPPYAVLGVDDVRNVECPGGGYLDVIEAGSRNIPCHCAITGYTGTALDLELQDDLAELANLASVAW